MFGDGEHFITSSIILKDERSLLRVRELSNLITSSQNLYYEEVGKPYCEIFPLHIENSIYIKMGGFLTSGPELKPTSVLGFDYNNFGTREEQDAAQEPVNFFSEIQKLLAKDSWFFVDGYSCQSRKASTSVAYYHQDGRTSFNSSHEWKRRILQELE